jgi:LacI family transcriptional regulator
VPPAESPESPPHIALLVETSLGSGRDILRGISAYARQRRNWSLFHEPRSLEESAPGWLSQWEGDGIIARIQNPQLAAAVKATGLPVVDVLGIVDGTGFPLVHVDDRAIAQFAIDHLYDRGLRKFGFFGIRGENWSDRRRDAVREIVAAKNCTLNVFEASREELHAMAWEKREDALAKWVDQLPRPAGVMVCSDQLGSDFMEACRRASVSVPDEIAVVGVDNDEPLCEVAQPPLSSVWPDHMAVGFKAASILDAMLQGSPAPARPTLIAPRKVVTRRSTDVLAIEDDNVAKALRVIREHGCEDINVDQIVRHSGLSRSVLQRRFRQVLGTTIHAEILNCRLKHACHLLSETEMSLMEIAERSGFKHQEYMGAVFKSKLRKTPGQFRRQNKFTADAAESTGLAAS